MQPFIIFLITMLMQNAVLSFAFLDFFRLRYTRRKTFLLILLLLCAGSIILTKIHVSTNIKAFLSFLFLLPMTRFFSTEKSLRILVKVVATVLLMAGLSHICIATVMYLGILEPSALPSISERFNSGYVVGQILCIFMLEAVLTIGACFYLRLSMRNGWRMIPMVLLMLTAESVLLITCSMCESPTDREYMLPIAISSYGLLCMIANQLCSRSISFTLANADFEEKLSSLRHQQDLQHQYILQAEKTASQTSKAMHDIRNQLQVISTLADSDPSRARQMASELTERVESIRPVYYTSNPTANTVLTLKAAKATAFGIDCSISCHVDSWPISDLDLCSMLCNLLDNAIEGCLEAKEQEMGDAGSEADYQSRTAYPAGEDSSSQDTSAEHSPYYPLSLSFKAGVLMDQLVIEVKNTCIPKELPNGQILPRTSKQGGNHGVGGQILDDIIRTNHGIWTAQYEDRIFRTVVSFDLTKLSR